MKNITNGITTEDIIKIIFYNNVPLMNKILGEYASADNAEKYDKQEILWDEYRTLRDELVYIEYQKMMNEIQTGKKGFEKNMMKRAHQIIDEYFQKILTGEIKDIDEIESIREKLQTMMQQTAPAVVN